MNDRFPPNETLSETALDRIEAACEAFEMSLRRGEAPRVEDYLERGPSEDRPKLREELILLEGFYRRDSQVGEELTTVVGRRAADSQATLVGARADEGRPDDEELQELLRRRLWMLALIGAGGLTLELLRILSGETLGMPHLFGGPAYWWYCASIGVLIAGLGALAVLLARRRSLPVARLRWVELAIIGSVAGWGAWATYAVFRKYLLPFANAPEWNGVLVMFLAHSLTLFWVTVIFAYALLIPNTWRRIVVATMLLAAVPLVVGAVVGGTEPSVSGGVLLHFLVSIGLWLGIAASFALYGAYRIESLRRQVLEGRRLGQYQLKQRLGRGGMGEVYLAEHALLRRPCAVKVIQPERAGHRATLLRFEREVQATAALTSPHTVEIYDYGHTREGLFYYVMEYLPGIDLERLVRDHGPLPPGRVIYLLRQLCSALQEAHGKGLIHRDIKPSNIILGERGGLYDAVKLLDFGLVRATNTTEDLESLTQEGWIAGTPAYLSPEQAQGRAEVDARSDIYSLGALAYFLLVGRPPFRHGSAMQTVAAHIYEPVVSPSALRSSLPRDLEATVLRCLAKDPARRYPDIASLQAALDRCATASAWTEAQARAWWTATQRAESV